MGEGYSVCPHLTRRPSGFFFAWPWVKEYYGVGSGKLPRGGLWKDSEHKLSFPTLTLTSMASSARSLLRFVSKFSP